MSRTVTLLWRTIKQRIVRSVFIMFMVPKMSQNRSGEGVRRCDLQQSLRLISPVSSTQSLLPHWSVASASGPWRSYIAHCTLPSWIYAILWCFVPKYPRSNLFWLTIDQLTNRIYTARFVFILSSITRSQCSHLYCQYYRAINTKIIKKLMTGDKWISNRGFSHKN